MNLAKTIEGSLAGAGTLTLLQEALHKVNGKSPRPFLNQSGILKKIKSISGKNGMKARKVYVKLGGELLATAAYFGLTGLGKKKNAILRGGLLGTAAGLASVFLRNDEEKPKAEINDKVNGHDHDNENPEQLNDVSKNIITVILYIAGGILAGLAVKKLNGKKMKKFIQKQRKVLFN